MNRNPTAGRALVNVHTLLTGGPMHQTEENGKIRWTHVLEIARPDAVTRLAVVPLHDEVLEQLLDNAEALMRGDAPKPRLLGTRTRVLRALIARASRSAPRS